MREVDEKETVKYMGDPSTGGASLVHLVSLTFLRLTTSRLVGLLLESTAHRIRAQLRESTSQQQTEQREPRSEISLRFKFEFMSDSLEKRSDSKHDQEEGFIYIISSEEEDREEESKGGI